HRPLHRLRRLGCPGPQRRCGHPLGDGDEAGHQMFPAPGVYEELMTELVITESALTTPLKVDIAAFTDTDPAVTETVLALTVTLADAVTVIPELSSFTELPLLSTISTEPGPSFSVIRWPPGVSTMSFSWPSLSSRTTRTPLRERMTLTSFSPPPSMDCGGASLPFHSPPTTNGQRGSPFWHATSTSSPVSGMNHVPRLLPPISV